MYTLAFFYFALAVSSLLFLRITIARHYRNYVLALT